VEHDCKIIIDRLGKYYIYSGFFVFKIKGELLFVNKMKYCEIKRYQQKRKFIKGGYIV